MYLKWFLILLICGIVGFLFWNLDTIPEEMEEEEKELDDHYEDLNKE